jgi:DNA-binding NtrC family response regulator
MLNEAITILVLDDEMDLTEAIGLFLRDLPNTSVIETAKPSEAFAIMEKTEIDIAIVDIRLPEMSGLVVLNNIKERFPQTEVIMISAHGDMDIVVECMRKGAFDYFSKPFMLKSLQGAVERTRKYVELKKQLAATEIKLKRIHENLDSRFQVQLSGKSMVISEIQSWINRIASFDNQAVLITGETGTGKEVVAAQIHARSERAMSPFIALNCTAVPEQLFESEMFGYRKGAFSGAETDKPGWFELADKGTLFLDEIGDIPMLMQSKLLRAIEEKKIWKLGASAPIDIDVRIIAATNRPLADMIKKGSFREDLYYRLNLFELKLPSLRERKEDIPMLIDEFITEFAVNLRKKVTSIDPQVYDVLSNYSFPGNIRQLRNLIERAVIICNSDVLNMTHFGHISTEIPHNEETLQSQFSNNLNLLLNEKNLIIKALEKSKGNKTKAASLLGITPQSLLRRIEKLKI